MAGRRVLVIVQNMPVPLDRRVWLQCGALRDAGYTVSVICPRGPGDPDFEVVDDVGLYKYSPPPQARGLVGYAWEFVYCWLRTALLSLRVRRDVGFDVMQACNPPDTYWALAALWKLRGVRFVYDQHDLNPELFISRFGEPTRPSQRAQYAGLRFLERMTYRLADRVISTNESYRRIAVERGGRAPQTVSVVRSSPDTLRMRPVVPPSGIRQGAEHVLAYLGIMGPQDDVDVCLKVMDELVNRRGRQGLRAVLMGYGDCLADLQRQCSELGLDKHVEFTGRVGPAQIADRLSAADVGLCPDVRTPLNDVSTMNKVMEYMAYAVPFVSFDLSESRITAADTGVFVPSGDLSAFADAVEALLDDDDRRVDLALRARRRVADELDWRPQAAAYLDVFDALTGARSSRSAIAAAGAESTSGVSHSPEGREYVPLDDEALRHFVSDRVRIG